MLNLGHIFSSKVYAYRLEWALSFRSLFQDVSRLHSLAYAHLLLTSRPSGSFMLTTDETMRQPCLFIKTKLAESLYSLNDLVHLYLLPPQPCFTKTYFLLTGSKKLWWGWKLSSAHSPWVIWATRSSVRVGTWRLIRISCKQTFWRGFRISSIDGISANHTNWSTKQRILIIKRWAALGIR